MGERYLISGTQLGLIEGLIKARKLSEAIKNLREIINKQFLTDTDGLKSVEEDAKLVTKLWEKYNKEKKNGTTNKN